MVSKALLARFPLWTHHWWLWERYTYITYFLTAQVYLICMKYWLPRNRVHKQRNAGIFLLKCYLGTSGRWCHDCKACSKKLANLWWKAQGTSLRTKNIFCDSTLLLEVAVLSAGNGSSVALLTFKGDFWNSLCPLHARWALLASLSE